MNSLEQVFIKRDGMGADEASRYANELGNDVYDSVCSGASYDEIEEMLLSEGLEMDYIEDMLF